MVGGLLDLLGYGVQDSRLKENPQVTFFNDFNYRHTPIESAPVLPFDSNYRHTPIESAPILPFNTEWICVECGFGFLPDTSRDTRCRPCKNWGPEEPEPPGQWDPNEPAHAW